MSAGTGTNSHLGRDAGLFGYRCFEFAAFLEALGIDNSFAKNPFYPRDFVGLRVWRDMSTFPNSPKLIKGGLVVLDAATGAVRRTIALQYNPDTLTRSYQVQGVGGEGGGERAQPFRLKGPAVESIKLEAEIDATDSLEHPGAERQRGAVRHRAAARRARSAGQPDQPRAAGADALSQSGTLEILPPEAPLVLFIWSASRVVPVRVTEFSITEEAFDAALNPIRAKVSLGLRVMTTDDLGFDAPRRQHLHQLPAHARGAGRQGRRGVAAVARPAATCRDDGRTRSMTDPVQLLIDAGAIPSTPFGPESRYRGVPLALLQRRPGEPGVVYVRRRFIPPPARIADRRDGTSCRGSDRPDLLAARLLRRSVAVLAHRRRQRGDRSERADRHARAAASRSRCRRAL